MIKKFIGLAIGLFFIALGLFFLWPLSFSGALNNDVELRIVITDISLVNGSPDHTISNYAIQPSSDSFESIWKVLNSFSFHRSIRTLFRDASINGNSSGYWLYLYSGEKMIISGGTGDIIVNGKVYRVGYWGNKSDMEMMDEIRGTLDG